MTKLPIVMIVLAATSATFAEEEQQPVRQGATATAVITATVVDSVKVTTTEDQTVESTKSNGIQTQTVVDGGTTTVHVE